MTVDQNHILNVALQLTEQRKPSSVLTVVKLAAFLGAETTDVLAVLKTAPHHVQQAFGVVETAQVERSAAAFQFPARR